jgi:hypothetical protein
MTATAMLAYAQTRLQARYGEAPDEGDWAALRSAVHFATVLERARETKLGPWVAAFSGTSSAHEIELALREQLRRIIEEVAGWLPHQWMPAVLWTKRLIDLPALAYLMHTEPPPAWMLQDSALKDFSIDDTTGRRAALSRADTAALISAWEAGRPLHVIWLSEWRRRWPQVPSAEARQLDELAALLQRHVEAFASTPLQDAWQQRRTLQDRLRRIFRRDFLKPSAAFAYLAIVALDFERLRAELMSSLLFRLQEASA